MGIKRAVTIIFDIKENVDIIQKLIICHKPVMVG